MSETRDTAASTIQNLRTERKSKNETESVSDKNDSKLNYKKLSLKVQKPSSIDPLIVVVGEIQETSEPVQEYGEVLENSWLNLECNYEKEGERGGFADIDIDCEGTLQIKIISD